MSEMDLDCLFQLTMKKKWDEVVKVYTLQSWAHSAKLTKSEETVLHVAVSSYNGQSERIICDTRDSILAMINSIPKSDLHQILSMRNKNGDTPLHLAAAVGWVAICECIASKDCALVAVRNTKNETPLFRAAHHGKLEAFLCLHTYSKDKSMLAAKTTAVTPEEEDDSLCRRGDGNTILHSAISGEYFRLAYQIISYYPKLVNAVNTDGETPLHILAKKPNVFKSSKRLGPYDAFIYHCVFVDELRKQKYVGSVENGNPPRSGVDYPENYRACVDIFWFLWEPIHKSIRAGFQSSNGPKSPVSNPTDEENQRTNSKSYRSKNIEDEDDDFSSFPANYATCFSLVKFAMKVTLTVLGVGFYRIRKIKEKKQRHSHALIIMNQMIDSEKSYKYERTGRQPVQKLEPQYSGRIALPATPPSADESLDPQSPSESNTPSPIPAGKAHNRDEKENTHSNSVNKDSPLIIAAKMGIPEMVEKILSTCPVAIQDLDSNDKNVLLLAAENRQTNVLDYLLKMKLPEYVFHQVDNEGNSILHLAAMLGDLQPWHIPGAALQMQWEIKWYKHVKHSIPPLSFAHNNINGETPRKIFARTHETLVKEGNGWLIKTSESCSVIAALIATVAFATSATVPGGLDEESGHPIMANHTAFDIFSITSLVALCLSVTALVFFLAIITSRCQESDFKSNLPKKLLMGLTSLFGSIAAMLVSFCAGHTFILREKLRLAAVPIYASACIPITFFAVAQLPLYFDLLWATFRRVPLRSYKVFYQ